MHPPYYLLTLNVDWFCPFEHGRYFVGAIYLTIQNLPVALRNHPGNVILVGIIPGPSEPQLIINSYLTPLTLFRSRFYFSPTRHLARTTFVALLLLDPFLLV